MKTTPNNSADKALSAPAMAAQALDQELSTAASGPASTVVNDLTSIVKKKKRKVDTDADAESSSTEKKARLDTPEA